MSRRLDQWTWKDYNSWIKGHNGSIALVRRVWARQGYWLPGKLQKPPMKITKMPFDYLCHAYQHALDSSNGKWSLPHDKSARKIMAKRLEKELKRRGFEPV